MSGLPDQTAERLLALESSVAHLQHDFDQLHQVLLDLQGELLGLRRGLDKINTRLEQFGDEPEVRDPAVERPPHY